MNNRIRLARAIRKEWHELSPSQKAPWLRMADRVLEAKGLNMEEKPKRLVEDWRDVLRRSWSIRLAVLAPVVLEAVFSVLVSLPPEVRVFISIPVFVVLAGAAIVARIWNQSK